MSGLSVPSYMNNLSCGVSVTHKLNIETIDFALGIELPNIQNNYYYDVSVQGLNGSFPGSTHNYNAIIIIIICCQLRFRLPQLNPI